MTIATTQAIFLSDLLRRSQVNGEMRGINLDNFTALGLEERQYKKLLALYYNKKYTELEAELKTLCGN